VGIAVGVEVWVRVGAGGGEAVEDGSIVTVGVDAVFVVPQAARRIEDRMIQDAARIFILFILSL
jgi:hypothetical protein